MLCPDFAQELCTKVFHCLGPLSHGLLIDSADFVIAATYDLILSIGAMHNLMATSHQVLKCAKCRIHPSNVDVDFLKNGSDLRCIVVI